MDLSNQMMQLDFVRAEWMLAHQIDCVNDLVKFWFLFGPALEVAPAPECTSEPWWVGIKIDVGLT